MPVGTLLTVEEIERLVRIAVGMGVTKVRITGGEPLVRADVVNIVSRLAQLAPRPELCLTTNGVGLSRLARPLEDAGLNRVNISLDTLDALAYLRLTGLDRLGDVLAGIEEAMRRDFTQVKLNAVALKGLTEEAGPALLEYALARGLELRFIEQMPLGGGQWHSSNIMTADDLLSLLSQHHELTPIPRCDSMPATRYLVDSGPGIVGVIPSVTRPFCGDCSRVRLTSDGQIRACLFSDDAQDVRGLVRSGADDAQIENALRQAIWAKRPGHTIGSQSFQPPSRIMKAIGG
jgi:cyclic pyranopterin phosphate synthase